MFCEHCGRNLNDDARFCPSCGKTAAQGIVLTKDEKRQAFKEKVRLDDTEKEKVMLRANHARLFFAGNIVLKILGILLKIICLPLVPILFLIGYTLMFASGLIGIVCGLLMLLVGFGVIMSIIEVVGGDPNGWPMLGASLLIGCLTGGFTFLVMAVPAVFMALGSFLWYFIFPPRD